MAGPIIAGAVLLGLILLLTTRVGVLVRFGQTGLNVRVRLGLFRLTIFPPQKPAARGIHPGAEKKKERRKEAQKPEQDLGGPWEQFQMYLGLGAEAAARLREKLRIDRLRLDVTWAATNPAAAALGYGYMNAALGALLPLIEQAFDVRERNVRTAVDFNGTSPAIFVLAECSLTIGQSLAMGILLLQKYRSEKKKIKKGAVSS